MVIDIGPNLKEIFNAIGGFIVFLLIAWWFLR